MRVIRTDDRQVGEVL